MNQRPDPSAWIRQAGLLSAIPMVLLVGPALGYYLGTLADRRWSWEPAGMIVGVLLGLAASGRVTAELIQQAKREQHR